MVYILFKEMIIIMIAYIGSVLYIFMMNKKNERMLDRKKYVLSVLIAPMSVIVECVLVRFLEIAVENSPKSNGMIVIKIIIVDEAYRLVSIFISALTMIIIFKLIFQCEISKKKWKPLHISIVISIVASIMQGLFLADVFSDIEEVSLRFIFNPAILLVAFIELIFVINRCMLVALSTWSVVNQLLKK